MLSPAEGHKKRPLCLAILQSCLPCLLFSLRQYYCTHKNVQWCIHLPTISTVFSFFCATMYPVCIRSVSQCIERVSLPTGYFTILHQTECHCVSNFRVSCSFRFIFQGSCFILFHYRVKIPSSVSKISQYHYTHENVFLCFHLRALCFQFHGFCFLAFPPCFFMFPFVSTFAEDSSSVKYHNTIILIKIVFCVQTWRTSVQISRFLFSGVHKTVFWCSFCFQHIVWSNSI